MFDDGRHETIESHGPRALGPPKSPFFGTVLTHYTQADEESSVDLARAEAAAACSPTHVGSGTRESTRGRGVSYEPLCRH